MKKAFSLLLVFLMVVGLAACGGAPASSAPPAAPSTADTQDADPPAGPTEPEGVENGRFTETRQITVEMFEREGMPVPNDDNPYIQFIKEGMLRDHNVEVEFQLVQRFSEQDILPQWIAANEVPDISYTYNKAAVDDFALQGGVLDLVPLLEEYAPYVEDVVNLLGEDLVYWDLDPNTGALYTMKTGKFNDAHQKTYVREDWLAALDMDPPSTLEEFETYLRAAKENAADLPGAPGADIIPYIITSDVGWTVLDLTESKIKSDMTDKEKYIWGWDDRLTMYPGFKDAIKIVNGWYNEGLLWTDFALYPVGDAVTPNNLTKTGVVGAMTQNVDVPYRRGGDFDIQYTLQQNPDTPNAAYIPVATFPNADGNYYKLWDGLISPDRNIFLPATNDEPLASLMYINWISKWDNLFFLMCGPEDIGHIVHEDGSIETVNPPEGDPYVRSSSFNIDMTMTVNNSGPFLPDKDLTVLSMAYAFSEIDPKYIVQMLDISPYTIDIRKNASAGVIAAEGEFGTALRETRDAFLAQAVTANVDDFDSVFDAGLENYMATGGQQIIDERIAAWEAIYGDADMIP